MMGITHIGVREIAKQSSTEDRNSTFSSLFALNLIYTLIALAIYLPLVFFVDRFWDTANYTQSEDVGGLVGSRMCIRKK